MLHCEKCDVVWSKVPRDKPEMDLKATIKLYKKRKCPDCGSKLKELTLMTGLSN